MQIGIFLSLMEQSHLIGLYNLLNVWTNELLKDGFQMCINVYQYK